MTPRRSTSTASRCSCTSGSCHTCARRRPPRRVPGLPIIRPLLLSDPGDPRGWAMADGYGYGPALWVAPVLEAGAREREVELPAGEWIDFWTGEEVVANRDTTVVASAPLDRIPVWVRRGALLVTYPAEHVAAGSATSPERERPLEATLWGEPRAAARSRASRTAPRCAGRAASGR